VDNTIHFSSLNFLSIVIKLTHTLKKEPLNISLTLYSILYATLNLHNYPYILFIDYTFNFFDLLWDDKLSIRSSEFHNARLTRA